MIPNEYAQESPSEEEALTALAELVGRSAAEGLWDLTARELNLSRPLESPADLRRTAEHLMNLGDLMRVAGRSTKVRVITYEALSRTVTS
jgi:predicted Zn-dependent protease